MDLSKKLRHVPNFPRQGIDFMDITTILQDAAAFQETIKQMSEKIADVDYELIVGTESRGFILGAPLAYANKKGFIPVRKQGKLPWQKISEEYDLEYGKDVLEMHVDAIKPGTKVLIVDDLLATGGTALANCRLIEKLGGVVAGVLFLIEIVGLNGSKRLEQYPLFTVMTVEEHLP